MGLFFLALKFSSELIGSEPIRVFVNNNTNKPLKITQEGRELSLLLPAFTGYIYAIPGAISCVISKRKHRSHTPPITYQLAPDVTSLEFATTDTGWEVLPSFHDDYSSQSDRE